MKKEEIIKEIEAKKNELETLNLKMGKVYLECDKQDALLKDRSSALKLAKYIVTILSLVSVTLLVSVINSFSLPFLFADILFVLCDTFSIFKLTKINKSFKSLTMQKAKLSSQAEDYYNQVTVLKQKIVELSNKIENTSDSQKVKPKKVQEKIKTVATSDEKFSNIDE